MKTHILLLFLCCLLFSNCKQEPEIVLDTPFKATIAHEAMNQFVKGIIVSNSLGGVLFEKVLTDSDKNADFEIDVLVDKEHKINVTLMGEIFGSFSGRTYYNLKTGVRIEEMKYQNSLFENHEITIEGVSSETFVRVGNGIIQDTLFEGNDLHIKTIYPTTEAFFIYLWDVFDQNHRYLYIQNPDSLIFVKSEDFKPLTETKAIEITLNSNFLNDNSRLHGIRDGEKDFPILGKIAATEDKFSIFEVSDWEADRYRLDISGSNMTYKDIVDELPSQINFACDFNSGSFTTATSTLFEDNANSSTAKYFRKNKFFLSGFGTSGSWSLEGIYEQGYSFRIPPISTQMKDAIPSLPRLSSTSFDLTTHFQFRFWDQVEVEKSPVIPNEKLFEWGTYSCNP